MHSNSAVVLVTDIGCLVDALRVLPTDPLAPIEREHRDRGLASCGDGARRVHGLVVAVGCNSSGDPACGGLRPERGGLFEEQRGQHQPSDSSRGVVHD